MGITAGRIAQGERPLKVSAEGTSSAVTNSIRISPIVLSDDALRKVSALTKRPNKPPLWGSNRGPHANEYFYAARQRQREMLLVMVGICAWRNLRRMVVTLQLSKCGTCAATTQNAPGGCCQPLEDAFDPGYHTWYRYGTRDR